MSSRTPCPITPPVCCGEAMADVTSIFDTTCGAYRFECVTCEFQVLATDDPDEGVPPGVPTDAPAGSPAKIDVMAARARMCETLFHPLDCTQRIDVAVHQTGPRTANGLPRGVWYDEGRGMYLARGRARKGRRAFLGWHESAEEAAAAVADAG